MFLIDKYYIYHGTEFSEKKVEIPIIFDENRRQYYYLGKFIKYNGFVFGSDYVDTGVAIFEYGKIYQENYNKIKDHEFLQK